MRYWYGLIGLLLGCLIPTGILLFLEPSRSSDLERIAELEATVGEQRDTNAELSLQVGPLEREVTSLRQDLATCQGAQAGREASLEDFYQELMYAQRFDMVVFDEGGQARRLVFDCGGNEQ